MKVSKHSFDSVDLPTRSGLRREGRPVLDLCARVFDGKRLRPDEYVISADEKSQPQALGRQDETSAAASGRPIRYEFEYERGGTLAYLPRLGSAPRHAVRSCRAYDRDGPVRLAR